MTEAPALPLLERLRTHRRPPDREGPIPSAGQAVEIVAPDRYCTALLLEYAAPLFPVEIVAGSGWVVRLQPPAGTGWVFELLSVLERWLEAARLPCAKVLYGSRSYLIRSSPDVAWFAATAESVGAGQRVEVSERS
jgi:hypothetical protein